MRDALRAIGREGMSSGMLRPDDFTGQERYQMIEAVLHAHAFPGGMEGRVPEWRVERRIYTLAEWQTGGPTTLRAGSVRRRDGRIGRG